MQTAALSSSNLEADDFPYRMKDLCERTGLPRQAIHFYIQQGLLPQGYKTGRNMAYYGEAHVQRLLLVRRLQHERFLPLKAIRALIDEQDGAFTGAQRAFLDDIRTRLGSRLSPEQRDPSTMRAADLLARTGVSRADFDRLVEIGLFGAGVDAQGQTILSAEDAFVVETWAEIRNIGLDEKHGFSVNDFALYEEAIGQLFQRETGMLKERLATVDPEVVAPMIERIIPVLNAFIARYHGSLIRNFFTRA